MGGVGQGKGWPIQFAEIGLYIFSIWSFVIIGGGQQHIDSGWI